MTATCQNEFTQSIWSENTPLTEKQLFSQKHHSFCDPLLLILNKDLQSSLK